MLTPLSLLTFQVILGLGLWLRLGLGLGLTHKKLRWPRTFSLFQIKGGGSKAGVGGKWKEGESREER